MRTIVRQVFMVDRTSAEEVVEVTSTDDFEIHRRQFWRAGIEVWRIDGDISGGDYDIGTLQIVQKDLLSDTYIATGFMKQEFEFSFGDIRNNLEHALACLGYDEKTVEVKFTSRHGDLDFLYGKTGPQ